MDRLPLDTIRLPTYDGAGEEFSGWFKLFRSYCELMCISEERAPLLLQFFLTGKARDFFYSELDDERRSDLRHIQSKMARQFDEKPFQKALAMSEVMMRVQKPHEDIRSYLDDKLRLLRAAGITNDESFTHLLHGFLPSIRAELISRMVTDLDGLVEAAGAIAAANQILHPADPSICHVETSSGNHQLNLRLENVETLVTMLSEAREVEKQRRASVDLESDTFYEHTERELVIRGRNGALRADELLNGSSLDESFDAFTPCRYEGYADEISEASYWDRQKISNNVTRGFMRCQSSSPCTCPSITAKYPQTREVHKVRPNAWAVLGVSSGERPVGALALKGFLLQSVKERNAPKPKISAQVLEARQVTWESKEGANAQQRESGEGSSRPLYTARAETESLRCADNNFETLHDLSPIPRQDLSRSVTSNLRSPEPVVKDGKELTDHDPEDIVDSQPSKASVISSLHLLVIVYVILSILSQKREELEESQTRDVNHADVHELAVRECPRDLEPKEPKHGRLAAHKNKEPEHVKVVPISIGHRQIQRPDDIEDKTSCLPTQPFKDGLIDHVFRVSRVLSVLDRATTSPPFSEAKERVKFTNSLNTNQVDLQARAKPEPRFQQGASTFASMSLSESWGVDQGDSTLRGSGVVTNYYPPFDPITPGISRFSQTSGSDNKLELVVFIFVIFALVKNLLRSSGMRFDPWNSRIGGRNNGF